MLAFPRARACVLAVAAVAISASAGAQQRPDFSGEWTIKPEEPVAAPVGGRGGRGARVGDMGSGWGSPITITQDANRLRVEYAFFTRGDLQPPLRFDYALDGSETTNTIMMGRGRQAQRSRVAWTGNSLVITTFHEFANPAGGAPGTAEVRQALSLESPGSLLVETTRIGVLGGPTTTTKTVYVKR